jgi:hypothetical protein
VDFGTTKLDRASMLQILKTKEAQVDWRHEAPEHEPLLWISDLVAFAWTAGGEQRRMAEPLVATVNVLESQ